jgi:hypothetical protein
MSSAARLTMLALLTIAGSASALAEIRCPALLEGHAYLRAGIFDGPPEEQADLVPDDRRGAWTGGRPSLCSRPGVSRIWFAGIRGQTGP